MNCCHPRSRNAGCGIALAALTCVLLPVANAQPEAQTPEAVRACQRMTEESARLDCYDRAFSPTIESVDGDDSRPTIESVDGGDSPPPPPQEPAAPASELESMARIVEVQMPNLSTTIFRAEDGRTFVRENATTVVHWPDAPFDVEIQKGFFGTSTYIKLPGKNPRIRVVVRN
jgi:hypothetical protein